METRKTTSRTGTPRTRSRRLAEDASADVVNRGDEVEGEGESTGAVTTTAGAPTAGNGQESTTGRAGGGIASRVRERATAQLASQKDRATDGLGTLAQAVRQTTDRLREERHETVAEYVEKAAEQLERLSNALRDKDVDELLDDARRLARRQPALFVGGSFAVGLLAARFLKSSRQEQRASSGDYDADQLRGAY